MSDAIRNYARANGFDENKNFAAACYDNNSVEELAAITIAVKNGANVEDVADGTDCKNWDITPEQWFAGIKAALEAKEADLN